MASGEGETTAERAAVKRATVRRSFHDAERRAAEAEEQLRRLQARYDALARAAGALTWVGTSDAPNADSTLWLALTGQAPDAVAANGWLDALHPDDRERVAQRWDRARDEATPFEMEYRLRDEAGAFHALRARVVPVLEADGTVREWVGRARDVTEQRRLERELAERARDLETIFDTLMDGVVVVDGTGRLVRVNAAARRLYERAIGPGFMDRSMAERTASLALYDETGQLLPAGAWPGYRMLRGETVDSQHAVDLHYRALDGSPVWVSMSGKPLRDADGQVIGGVLVYRDVDERRRAARRNQEALDALLAMAETLVRAPDEEPAATEEMDPDAPPAARYPIAYRMAELTCAVLGCSRVGITLIDPVTHLQRPIVVVGLDLETERRWWKEQLAQTLRFGEAPAGTDPADTARFVAMFRAGEIAVIDLSKPPYDQLPNDYNVRTMLAAPMLVGEQLVGILSLDHSGAEHEFTPDELRLAQGIAQLTALVVERERLLEEREEARVRLRALAETNRRMNEFLGVAGHELRTPLTSMKANVQLGQRYLAQTRQRASGAERGVARGERDAGAEWSDRIAELFARIVRQLGRQERLVNDLLDVSRIEGGRLELRMGLCDLGAIVRQEVEEQRLQHPTRAIHLEMPEAPVLVHADGDRIAQVVTNYLTNGLKYAAAGTPVWVRVGVEKRAAGRVARVLVRDSGPGLAPDQRERVWERFHRAPDVLVQSGSGIGLGLGLYISRTIIERHDGQVGVESAPGEGSTFWFTLPLADRGAEVPADNEA
jgi:PAS domain S-box-containing protein